MSVETIELKDARGKGRNGYFSAKKIEVYKIGDKFTIDVSSSRVGNPPIILEITREDANKLANALKTYEDVIEADLLNAIENEGISSKLATDHPDLIKDVAASFNYDYSDYNYAMLEALREKAASMGIDMSLYENEQEDTDYPEDTDGGSFEMDADVVKKIIDGEMKEDMVLSPKEVM